MLLPVWQVVFKKVHNAVKPPPATGAVHSAEIEYAMGNLQHNKVYAWTQDDYTVSKYMQEYFANFVKTGDPMVQDFQDGQLLQAATLHL